MQKHEYILLFSIRDIEKTKIHPRQGAVLLNTQKIQNTNKKQKNCKQKTTKIGLACVLFYKNKISSR